VGILSLGLLVISGCGGGNGGMHVKGTVVENGKALSLSELDYIVITLHSADGQTTYTGELARDGSFAIESGEVPLGTYTVTMKSQDPDIPPAFGGKFAEGVSTLEVTVEDGKEQLDPIDIAKRK